MHPRFGTKQKLDRVKEKLEIEVWDMETEFEWWEMRYENWVLS